MNANAKMIISGLMKRRETTWEIPALACLLSLLLTIIFATPVFERIIRKEYPGYPMPTSTQLFLGAPYLYFCLFGLVVAVLFIKDRIVDSARARKVMNLGVFWITLVICVVYVYAMLSPLTRLVNVLGG